MEPQAILLLMITLTAIFTIVIHILSKPIIQINGQNTRKISANDYNVTYDILSATALTMIYTLSFTDRIENLNISTAVNSYNFGATLLICFMLIVFLYIFIMKTVGWKKDSENLSIAGIFASAFFSIISLMYVFNFLNITGA